MTTVAVSSPEEASPVSNSSIYGQLGCSTLALTQNSLLFVFYTMIRNFALWMSQAALTVESSINAANIAAQCQIEAGAKDARSQKIEGWCGIAAAGIQGVGATVSLGVSQSQTADMKTHANALKNIEQYDNMKYTPQVNGSNNPQSINSLSTEKKELIGANLGTRPISPQDQKTLNAMNDTEYEAFRSNVNKKTELNQKSINSLYDRASGTQRFAEMVSGSISELLKGAGGVRQGQLTTEAAAARADETRASASQSVLNSIFQNQTSTASAAYQAATSTLQILVQLAPAA
jgi:hypothetical protein